MPRSKVTLSTSTSLFAAALVALAAWLAPAGAALGAEPKRGDINSDGKVDIGDPIFLLGYIFLGGKAPECPATSDADASGHTDISDAIRILTFLFSAPVAIVPLTDEEIRQCESASATVVRSGLLKDISEPSHGISGEIQQLSNRMIRLKNFHYDGLGVPQVVVLLTRNSQFDNVGFAISPDLARGTAYVGETLEYALPEDATDEDFRFATIWCDVIPLTFAYAELKSS